jgi:DNA-binding FrmR family transcriptional regulator
MGVPLITHSSRSFFNKDEKGGKSLEYNKQIQNRVKRAEGQIKGILNMMAEEKDCKDVITQMSAIRTAIDRTIGLVVSTNLEQCVREQVKEGADTSLLVDEAVQLLVKTR